MNKKHRPGQIFEEITGQKITKETTVQDIDRAVEKAHGKPMEISHGCGFPYVNDHRNLDKEIDDALKNDFKR